MTRFHRIVRLHHKPENLFDLVSDIQSYPKFIRWVRRMDVQPLPSEGSVASSIGTAAVGFSGFSETMSTRVDADPSSLTIQVSLIRGPLSKLNNRWQFKPAGSDSTDVDFFVDFEFRNFILRALAAANFETAVNHIMSSFVSEADRRYGRPSPHTSINV